MKLSVIVPVYNTAEYLPQCLESILAQTFDDMEIICIDDGSVDGSGEILDRYAEENKKMRVKHTENRGALEARKTGLMLASGEYIGFVDSDDRIEPDMYESLVEVMDEQRVDLVSSGYTKADGSRHLDCHEEKKYSGPAMKYLRDNAFYNEEMREVGIRPALVTKLYRKALLDKVFETVEGRMPYSEDRALTIAYILEADSAYVLRRTYYHYEMRSTSVTHMENPYYVSEVNKVYLYFCSLYSHSNFTDQMKKHAELYFISLLIDGINSRIGLANPYLMWNDPDWIEKIPAGASVVIYGAGVLGRICYRNIIYDRKQRLMLAGWVDQNYASIKDTPVKVEDPKKLREMNYDCILVAVRDSGVAEKIIGQLMDDQQVPAEKIYWFPFRDFFWKYAEAMGIV